LATYGLTAKGECWIDIADDNFIGNRLKTKPLLGAVANWFKENKYPFFFSTEESVNLAHDDELLDLVLDTTRRLNMKSKHRPNWWELRRMLRGWFILSSKLLAHKPPRYYYLRNAWKSLWLGPAKFIFAHQLIGSYLHFARQTKKMMAQLDLSMEFAKSQATYPRSVAELRERLGNADLDRAVPTECESQGATMLAPNTR